MIRGNTATTPGGHTVTQPDPNTQQPDWTPETGHPIDEDLEKRIENERLDTDGQNIGAEDAAAQPKVWPDLPWWVDAKYTPGSAQDPEFKVTDESTVDDRLGAEATGETSDDLTWDDAATKPQEWMNQLVSLTRSAFELVMTQATETAESVDYQDWVNLTRSTALMLETIDKIGHTFATRAAQLQPPLESMLQYLFSGLFDGSVQVHTVDLRTRPDVTADGVSTENPERAGG
jgi:hypothetical protein